MTTLDPFEPGTHTFNGVVQAWTAHSGELITDSGLVLFLNTEGQPPVPIGTRITVRTRRYRPCYLVTNILDG
jgi:hypothetical protein